MTRVNYIRMPELRHLEHSAAFVARAFNVQCCYLVGSATRSSAYHDVDVRVILSDQSMKALFGCATNYEVRPFWSLINTAVSLYMSQQTGLTVDFQVQSRTVSERHTGEREPVGLFMSKAPDWAQCSEDL